MTLDEIKRAIAKLSTEERAALRTWLAQAEAGFSEMKPAPEPERDNPTATKLGRLTGRAFADIRKRWREI